MTYVPKKKSTFLMPAGPQDKLHLFVILTEKCSTGYHLIANITSIHAPPTYHDPTCEVDAGEHPWVTRDSYVFYAKIEVIKNSKLVANVDNEKYPTRPDVTNALFARIRDGILRSPHTKPVARDYYREQLATEEAKAEATRKAAQHKK